MFLLRLQCRTRDKLGTYLLIVGSSLLTGCHHAVLVTLLLNCKTASAQLHSNSSSGLRTNSGNSITIVQHSCCPKLLNRRY